MIEDILNKIKEIDYGWVDSNKIVHHSSKRNFFLENYRLQTIEDTLKYKVGTCWEQVELTRYYAKQHNLEIETYIIIYNDPTKIARHSIAVANLNNKYYYLENSWKDQGKNIEFDNIKDILHTVVNQFPRMYKINEFDLNKIEIYNYSEPNPGLSFEDFTNYCRKGEKINYE